MIDTKNHKKLMRRTAMTLVVAALSLTGCTESEYADRVYRGGTIVTMDSALPRASAVAIKGNKIVAVGSNDDIQAYLGEDTEITDLAGNTLIPGFIDAHSHLLFEGMVLSRFVDLNSPPVGKIENIDQIIARLKARVGQASEGEWIFGFGYDDTLIEEHRHPTREDLDKVSTEHPVWVSHVSGHMGVGNSVALALAGIDENTPDPEGGVIHRYKGGRKPTGLLEESAAMGPVMKEMFGSIGAKDAWDALQAAQDKYVSVGITTAQDGGASKETIGAFKAAKFLGGLKLRVVAYPVIDVKLEALKGEYELPESDEWLKIGATKLFSDGSIQGYTGYLSHHYHQPRDEEKPEYAGYPQTTREELAKQVMAVHKSGGQIAIHGNGDAAIDDILYAFEQAQNESPRADARPIIIHSQMAREDQLDKMAELGVIPSMFNMHTYYWGDRHRDIFIGPERAARISPAKSALDRGITYTFHADTPVVPMEPLRMLWSAVTRETAGGDTLGADQQISAEDALKGLTINAAHQYFDEDIKGSITVGKLADLVVLDANPLEVPVDEILNIAVLETVIDGEVVYEKP
ncbi:amidohydrolase [Microbulbifer bruguierae]|uniref:Amidohydrolase n=1 Tax=Microbulbifer bruguierae TaxID=3029061 RepID=A0ABY8NA63_9GAMM|nr:amidohydrolase [Microbulbifer bruguierae]WGL15796.1 amidohydrolase [Microbulbifer bruguierae]